MTPAAEPDRDNLRLNLALAVGMMAVLVVLRHVQGEIDVAKGLGYDGADYARGIVEGVARDKPNIGLRPLVLWLNQPAYLLTGDVIQTFRLMNVVYAGVLAFALCSLSDLYSSSRAAKLLLIGNLSLCISTLQMTAYYPVLVDLGAIAAMAMAVLAIVRDHRLASAVLVALAVLAREFSAACILFGLARDLRRRVSPATSIATYAPAVAIFIALRVYVATSFTRRPVSAAQMFGNLAMWLDPVFAAVFVYFLLTVFGGISLFLVSSPGRAAGLWRKQWEWPLLVLPIIAAAALGDLDIWRYLVYLLPAATVAFAVSWRDDQPHARLIAAVVTLATLVTQRPFRTMSVDSYFVDWFPLYVHALKAPLGHPASMWPVWTWRFGAGVALLIVIVMVSRSSGPKLREID